jgi:LmbE family N-acetylglucosaminyl deacetylase
MSSAPRAIALDACRAPEPRCVAAPARGTVVLLAPHADDDVIGAGGTAALHARQGDRVHVIVVFDGLAGDPHGRYAPGELLERRRREARAGGAHLGLTEYEFWDYPEGHVPGALEFAAGVRRLAARLRELAPATVYAPWVGEHHMDHHVLARVARLALQLADFRGEAWGYEVWTPLVPSLIVDITELHAAKVRALHEHESQMGYTDYVHKVLGMQAQRSLYLPAQSLYGEAFAPLGAPAAEDRALLDG